MKSRHEKYLKLLTTIAEGTPRVSSASLASCIVYKNEIVSIGTNQYKTHPLQKKYGTNKESIFLHAEISAIHNALRRLYVDDFRHSTIYTVRSKFNKQGNPVWGIAKPCSGCMRAIVEFDFKKVVYTVDDGVFEEL